MWRCGNRGNVASVLIEKPARGDFLPILDGGYSLQYSPLLEYREGKGMVLCCQMDVTGRTADDPAATRLIHNLLSYACDRSHGQPTPDRQAVYVGDPVGQRHLAFAGIAAEAYDVARLSPEQVLIVGTGGGQQLAGDAAAIADFLAAGGHLLALGLDEQETAAWLPFSVGMQRAEHIATFFESAAATSPLAGVGPADVHNRAPLELPLVSEGATVIGNGVLATGQDGHVVFFQFPPYSIAQVAFETKENPAALTFDGQHNLKQTYRRASFVLTRLLANMGVRGETPLLSRFSTRVRVTPSSIDGRGLQGLYLDQPEEWDDPYRFFRW